MAKLLLRALRSRFPSASPSFELLDEDTAPLYRDGELFCPFSRIPPDLFHCIFSLLPAHDLVAASLVCKAWFSVIFSFDSLWQDLLAAEAGSAWPLVLFAETSLRSLPPFTKCEEGPNFFRGIYGSRQKSPCSVVIDGGSGYCKYGWSFLDRPSGRFPTFLAHGNVENPMYNSLMDFFTNIYERLSARPALQPVVISTPIYHYNEIEVAAAARRTLRHVTHKVLFNMGVQAVCAVDQAILALIAAQQTSGLVVNIGFQLTSIVPIRQGKIMWTAGVETIGQGALQLTAHLCELMQQRGVMFDNIAVVKALKERLCYVAEDYDTELSRNTEATCILEDQGTFKLNHERFMACEILFQPHLGGLRTMSLQQAIALCIDHCTQFSDGTDSSWFQTIVLSGGSASLPGLGERLKKELQKLLPGSIFQSLKIISPTNGEELAWSGARLISNMSCFQETWCVTRKEYQKYGQNILDAKACF